MCMPVGPSCSLILHSVTARIHSKSFILSQHPHKTPKENLKAHTASEFIVRNEQGLLERLDARWSRWCRGVVLLPAQMSFRSRLVLFTISHPFQVTFRPRFLTHVCRYVLALENLAVRYSGHVQIQASIFVSICSTIRCYATV